MLLSLAAREALGLVAQNLGFSGWGIASASLPQGDGLSRWLASGANAGMDWMERHLSARLNPQLVLEDARSVIMLSFNYAQVDARVTTRELGRVARYAQGVDYHRFLAAKLADIDDCLQLFGGKQRCFSDSGPVSERFFAQQAGLGWLGRHGLLIHPKRGSFSVLSSILTTLELPYDKPMSSHCGSCRRCEQACPTAALSEGFCDARRCLSYWTIEAREDIPADIEALAGDRLFGCDICQEVCPWNQGEQSVDPRMLMPSQIAACSLENFATLNEVEFERLFAGSPIRRAGLTRFQQRVASILRLRDEG